MTFFDEPFGWAHIIGIPLTIVGVMLVSRSGGSRSGDAVSFDKGRASSPSAD
jgi:drug/metabolite transporter (DMT)-like permease